MKLRSNKDEQCPFHSNAIKNPHCSLGKKFSDGKGQTELALADHK